METVLGGVNSTGKRVPSSKQTLDRS